MSDILIKVNQVGLNLDWPIAGQNNSSVVFRTNNQAILAGLTQANTELTRVQNTRFSFSGDATGQSARVGSAVVVGGGDPLMEVDFTLADVQQGPLTLDSRTQDFSIAMDRKGRVLTTQTFSHDISWASGHTAGSMLGVGGTSLGSGTGSIVIPTVGFNAQGRLIATGKSTISYGLLEHTLNRGNILVGNNQNKSVALAPPTDQGSYALVSTGASLSWQPVGAGTVSGIIGGLGISVSADESSPTVSLDLSELTQSATFLNTDELVLLTSSGPRRTAINELQKTFRLVRDTDPYLGGNLDVNGFSITSSDARGVTLRSSASNPTSSLTVSPTGLRLVGSNAAPVMVNSPSLTLNGVVWVASRGAPGQILVQGLTGLEWTNRGDSQVVDRTLFVSQAGDDTSGTGGFNTPYQTIGRAVSQVPNNANDLWTVVILGGAYTEDVEVQNKKKIALEGWFSSTNVLVKGSLQVNFGVDVFNMSRITWDSSNREASDPVPTMIIQNGLVNGRIQDCEFLRVDRTGRAVELYGQTTGPVVFQDNKVLGTFNNQMEFSEAGQLIVHNIWDKLDKCLPIKSSDASRTITEADVGTYIRVNNNQDNELRVAEESVQPMPLGARIEFSQIGIGRTSVIPLGNVTINTPNGYVLRKRYSAAKLTYVGQNIWDLSGDLDETVQNAEIIKTDSDVVTVDSDTITADNG